MHTFGTIGQCHMYAHCNLPRWCLSGHSWLCTLIHLSLNPRGVGPAAHFQHRVAQSNTDSRLSILLPGVQAAIGQTLEGSFSAVQKPNFTSKYAFESSRRDLHNALESNPLMKRNGWKEENGKIGRKQSTPLHSSVISIFSLKNCQHFRFFFKIQ